MASRRREPPRVEDSWRLVEGEHDSFDTSILPSVSDNDPLAPLSSEQPSSGFPSQLSSSQGQMSIASQDSIRDFSRHQDDDQVILREPFRPSLPGAQRSSASVPSYRTPDPEFRMPTVDIDGKRRSPNKRNALARGKSSGAAAGFGREDVNVRRRPNGGNQGRTGRRRPGGRDDDDQDYYDDDGYDEHGRRLSMHERIAESLPAMLGDILLWVLGIVSLAFRYAQKPLALLLAIYLSFGAIIIAQNMITKSIFVSLSPICRVPGVSLLHLPFCPEHSSPTMFPNGTSSDGPPVVEFDDLMGVQAKFEQVLERSAEGVSLPMEMKRSEMTIRDLRTLLRNSEIVSRDELILEIDGYIDTARQTGQDLGRFNTHCGSAVDKVVAINRWTARYIDSLAPSSPSSPSSSSEEDASALGRWTSWLFTPFQPPERSFSERMILDKYIEHTALVSDRISALILEAQGILRLLTQAEDQLSLIYEITSRTSASTADRRDQVFWNLWTLLGANSARLHNLEQQLSLLRQVDAQRTTAIAQVSALVLELEAIQAGLGDLRDRVAEPELVRDSATIAIPIPLSVHIETIDRGVERLEAARRRIRSVEEDNYREALAKGGVREDERLIDGAR